MNALGVPDDSLEIRKAKQKTKHEPAPTCLLPRKTRQKEGAHPPATESGLNTFSFVCLFNFFCICIFVFRFLLPNSRCLCPAFSSYTLLMFVAFLFLKFLVAVVSVLLFCFRIIVAHYPYYKFGGWEKMQQQKKPEIIRFAVLISFSSFVFGRAWLPRRH